LVKKVTIPSKIRAGDLVQWRDNATTDTFGNPISSPDWTVIYYLRTNKSRIGTSVVGTAYGDGFQFSIPSATTEAFYPGDWYFQAVASKSGAETQTIASGQIEVLASLAYTGTTPAAYDGRTPTRKDLDTVQAAIRTLMGTGGAVQEYKIGTRSAKKYDLAELRALESQLLARVHREEAAEKIANGLGNPHSVHVRFGA
tara:strand:+ start:1455 stop:2051 length:597 start_codon:yes stop_codon:yes gene_type:complete